MTRAPVEFSPRAPRAAFGHRLCADPAGKRAWGEFNAPKSVVARFPAGSAHRRCNAKRWPEERGERIPPDTPLGFIIGVIGVISVQIVFHYGTTKTAARQLRGKYLSLSTAPSYVIALIESCAKWSIS